jgi:hypothetical protein
MTSKWNTSGTTTCTRHNHQCAYEPDLPDRCHGCHATWAVIELWPDYEGSRELHIRAHEESWAKYIVRSMKASRQYALKRAVRHAEVIGPVAEVRLPREQFDDFQRALSDGQGHYNPNPKIELSDPNLAALFGQHEYEDML